MKIIINNVRSFVKENIIPIKPLTLLTGGNSSGKSTFLASLSIVNDPFGFPFRPRFNEPPYSLGNYDTIATNKGGRYGRATTFSLGFETEFFDPGPIRRFVVEYKNVQGLIEVSKIETSASSSRGTIDFSTQQGIPSVTIEFSENDKEIFSETIPLEEMSSNLFSRMDMSFILYSMFSENRNKKSNKTRRIDEKQMRQVLSLFRSEIGRSVLSIAPIRMKPRRTYDEIMEDFSPEGEHIPFVLSSLLSDENKARVLRQFGKDSGLFTGITIRKLGTHIGDPAQVTVATTNKYANLMDVGYGVSQVLPVAVESIRAKEGTLLLLQQPEVHLHPKAQAALGSLFVNLTNSEKKQFVIETHSDFIIDRIRIDVAKKLIPSTDVSILYFEKQKHNTKVHVLRVNDAGDIEDAPRSYREFFLQEELSLLSRME